MKLTTRLYQIMHLYTLIFPAWLHRNLFTLYYQNAFTKVVVEVVVVVVVDRVVHVQGRLLLELQVMV